MPASPPPPDLCVIGGGTAGHAVALAAAALGARCTLVDPRARLGAGQAADLAGAMLGDAAHARLHGPADAGFDLAAFRQRVGKAVADQAPNHAAERLRTLGVTVIRAEASFADARTLLAGTAPIRARRFVLATGGRVTMPPWAATVDPGRLLRPAALVRLAVLPRHVAVVAEAPEGFTWAQVLRRLGCAVTLIAAKGAEAPFDPMLMPPLLAALRSDGVELHLGSTVVRADAVTDGMRLWTDGGDAALTVTHLLVARPGAPAIERLALDRAGIACRQGAPVVDTGLRTGNRRIFALGDVLGAWLPGGGAVPHQVGLVLRAALFRQPVRYRPERVAITLPTQPALAQVGVLSGGQVGGGGRVLRSPLSDTMGGAVSGAAGGVTVITTAGGRVLGAGIVGPGADEAIAVWTLAVARAIPASAMAALPMPAAPLAEASRRAGLNLVTARLASPWIKRLLRLLRALP